MKENRIAVFIDAENVTSWIKHDGITLLVEELMPLGQIIVRRAYGVWSRPQLAGHQAGINQQGFELIHCFHPITGKNTADIQMTVDVIECAWQLPNINCFVLVTGDSDFSPVFRRLREMDKEVIGVGNHSTLSECVKTSCSRFIYTDAYVENREQPLATNKEIAQISIPATSNVSVVDTSQLKDVNALVIQLLKDAQDGVNTSQLKNALINKFGVFDQGSFGFKSFTDFLTAIAGVTLAKVGNVNYATLEEKQPTIKVDAGSQKQASAEYYASLLNKHNLRLINADRMKKIYKQATATKGTYSELSSLKDAVFTAAHQIDGQLSKADVNKAFNIFVKMALIHTEKAKGGIDAIKVKKLVLKDFLLKIDKLIITTLIELCKDNLIELKVKEIKKITVSTISKDNIKKLIGEK